MFGAVIGDIVGSRYDYKNHKSKDFDFFDRYCLYTDDTVCTVAVAKVLLDSKEDYSDLEALTIKYLKEFHDKYPDSGYGTSFDEWCKSDSLEPYNSWGNGSAMRVSACGWLGKSLKEVEELAERTASVTHNHPEGIKGAKAIAAAIYLALSKNSKEEIKEYIVSNYYPNAFDKTIDEIRPNYKFDVSCQGSVPIALQCFIESKDFEDAIRTAISVGGDSDTIAAMCGSIAEAYYGIPSWIKSEVVQFIPFEFYQILRIIK